MARLTGHDSVWPDHSRYRYVKWLSTFFGPYKSASIERVGKVAMTRKWRFGSMNPKRSATPQKPSREPRLGRFTTIQESAVGDFLQRNDDTDFVGMLDRIAIKLEAYFPDVDYKLEKFSDPETPSDELLVVSVVVERDPDEAYDQLCRIEDEWWLDKVHDVDGRICIRLEFR